MEIKPIELSFSKELQEFIDLMEWAEKEWEKEVLKMMIKEDQVGTPTSISTTTQKLLTYNPSK